MLEKKKIFAILFFFIFIIGMINVYLTIIIGILILIFWSLLFYYFVKNEDQDFTFQLKIMPENLIKIILMIFMCITAIIPPISSNFSIILWNKVEFLNYLRAVAFLIGLAYLPGACIYNIIFYKDNIHEVIRVESFLFKITLYPLISFGFLGLSVLILDQIGFIREIIAFFLFLILLGLFLVDLITQNKRKNRIRFKFKVIKISNYYLLILIFLLGFFFFSFGMQCYLKYIYVGDVWATTSPAFYIGRSNIIPYEDMNYYRTYPFFWGYLSFGLSVMSGLPYININTILIAFSYLYITSNYILIKAILRGFHEKYILLSTVFVLILQVYFYVFFLMYKAYSWSLLYLCIALFIGIITRNDIKISVEADGKNLIKMKEFKILILGVFFLMIGFMTYVYPLIIGLIFIFLYCLFSEKRKRPYIFKYLIYFVSILIPIFIFFDLLMNFHLSNLIVSQFLKFFQNELIQSIFNIVPRQILIYMFLIGILFSLFFFKYIFFKISEREINFKLKLNKKNIFYLLLFIFTILIIIEVVSVISYYFFILNIYGFNVTNFMFHLDLIFICLALIGIIAIYLTFYFFYKRKKRLFYILLSWIISSIILVSINISYEWITNFPIQFEDLSSLSSIYNYFWFSKCSIYICPLSGIFTSFFLIQDINVVTNNFLLCYLDAIFMYLGLIGIIAIYLSYYCYKRKKRLFYILLSWIIISIILGSIMIFYEWITNFPLSPREIPTNNYSYMIIWFDKIIRYAYLPISVIASIGIFEFIKVFKNKVTLKRNKFLKHVLRYFIISIVLSSFTLELIVLFNKNNYILINDDEVQIIGWASENIPYNSNIIIENNKRLTNGLKTMTFCRVYYINEIFKKEKYNQTEFDEKIEFLKFNGYQYILVSQNFITKYNNGRFFINNFYNNTLYQCGGYNISYAPYFE